MSQPGWYPDPSNPHVSRYWSGHAWLAERTWNGSQWVQGGAPAYSASAPAYSAPAPAYAAPAPAYSVAPAYPTYHQPVAASPRTLSGRVANRAWLTVIGAVLAAVGCLLPWATQNDGFESVSISGTSAGGGQVDIVLALLIALLTGLFLTSRTGFKTNLLSLILAALLIVICVANMANISHVIDQETAAAKHTVIDASPATSFGVGIILVLIGGCLALIGLILTMVAARKASRPS